MKKLIIGVFSVVLFSWLAYHVGYYVACADAYSSLIGDDRLPLKYRVLSAHIIRTEIWKVGPGAKL